MFRRFAVIAACFAVILSAGSGNADARLTRKRTDSHEISAANISLIRFRDIVCSDFKYKGISGADHFTIVITRSAKADDEEECLELLDMFDLEMETEGEDVNIRLIHPKYRKGGFLKSIFGRKEWKVTLEVSGPRIVDIDVETAFSTLRFDQTEGKLDLDAEFSSVETRDHTGHLKSSASFSEVNVRDLDGSFAVSTDFGHVNLRLAHLGGNSSARINFGAVDIRMPRSSGAEFNINKSFGKVDFAISGDYVVKGEKGSTRIINGGGPRVDLEIDFGGVSVRNNLSEHRTTSARGYVQDAVMPLNRRNWWRYSSGEKTADITVESIILVKNRKTAKLVFEGAESRPFDSIDVSETSEGLFISGIEGDFFGWNLSGLKFEPPRLWLPYSDSGDIEGDILFGAAKVIEFERKKDTESAEEKNSISFIMQTGDSQDYELKLVPGVGFTSFGDDLKLVDYNLEGVRQKKPAAVSEEKECPPPPKFEEGEVTSLTFLGLRYLPKSKVEELLDIEKGSIYSRDEIADEVKKLPRKNKFIDSTSYTIDTEGNLKVRIHEAELYRWDWDGTGSFSRVAGVGLGPCLTLKSLVGPFSELSGGAQYHWGNREWTFTADLQKSFFERNRMTLGASYRLDYETNMDWAIPAYDSYLNALLLGLETTNYYQVEGASGYISQSFGHNLDVKAEYFEEDFDPVKKNTNWSVFNQRHIKEDNPLLSPEAIGSITGVRLSAELRKGFTFSNAMLSLSLEKTNERRSDSLPVYTRFLGSAVYTSRIPYHNIIKIRVAGGYSKDDLPEQKAFRLGGLNTLRGFDFGSVHGSAEELTGGFIDHSGGNRMFLANIDYFLGDVDEFCMVLFGDVGGVWRKGDDIDVKDLRRDLGIGLVFEGDFFPLEDRRSNEIVDALRINWAVPVGPEPHVSHWTVNFVRSY